MSPADTHEILRQVVEVILNHPERTKELRLSCGHWCDIDRSSAIPDAVACQECNAPRDALMRYDDLVQRVRELMPDAAYGHGPAPELPRDFAGMDEIRERISETAELIDPCCESCQREDYIATGGDHREEPNQP